MRIVAGVGDLMRRIRDGQTQVGYSVTRRSRGQVTLCAVCSVHKKTMSADFLVEPKTKVKGLASKPLRQFLPVWPENR
jgi:hypothetical protein